MAFIPDNANKLIRRDLSPNAGDLYRALCEYRNHAYRAVFLVQPDGRELERILLFEWNFALGSQRNALTELARNGWIHRHGTHIELLMGDFSPVDSNHPQKELAAFVNAQKRPGRKTLEKKLLEPYFPESGKIENELNDAESLEINFPESGKIDFINAELVETIKCFHCLMITFHETMKFYFPETGKYFPETGKYFPETGKYFPETGKTPYIRIARVNSQQNTSRTPAEHQQVSSSGGGNTRARARGGVPKPETPPPPEPPPAAAAGQSPKWIFVSLLPAERKMTGDEFRDHLVTLYPEVDVPQSVRKYRENCREKGKTANRESLKRWVHNERPQITEEFLTAMTRDDLSEERKTKNGHERSGGGNGYNNGGPYQPKASGFKSKTELSIEAGLRVMQKYAAEEQNEQNQKLIGGKSI